MAKTATGGAFVDAVLAAVRAIPRGEVRSYAHIARLAGRPRGARQVARILAAAADPALPWHRVVRADGRIAFAPGSAGHREQRRRLRAEGVAVRAGRVAPPAAEAPTLDALLWAPR